MSLTIIAVTGVLLGFLCVAVGFLMEGTDGRSVIEPQRARKPRKRVVNRRKAA